MTGFRLTTHLVLGRSICYSACEAMLLSQHNRCGGSFVRCDVITHLAYMQKYVNRRRILTERFGSSSASLASLAAWSRLRCGSDGEPARRGFNITYSRCVRPSEMWMIAVSKEKQHTQHKTNYGVRIFWQMRLPSTPVLLMACEKVDIYFCIYLYCYYLSHYLYT